MLCSSILYLNIYCYKYISVNRERQTAYINSVVISLQLHEVRRQHLQSPNNIMQTRPVDYIEHDLLLPESPHTPVINESMTNNVIVSSSMLLQFITTYYSNIANIINFLVNVTIQQYKLPITASYNRTDIVICLTCFLHLCNSSINVCCIDASWLLIITNIQNNEYS